MSWLWLSDIPITPKLTSPTLIVSSVLSSLLSAYRGDKVVDIVSIDTTGLHCTALDCIGKRGERREVNIRRFD